MNLVSNRVSRTRKRGVVLIKQINRANMGITTELARIRAGNKPAG